MLRILTYNLSQIISIKFYENVFNAVTTKTQINANVRPRIRKFFLINKAHLNRRKSQSVGLVCKDNNVKEFLMQRYKKTLLENKLEITDLRNRYSWRTEKP